MIALPLLALPLYLALGRPDLPGHSFAGDAAPEAMPETVQAAIARLADHLKANPNDLEGWTLLARSKAKLGQPDEAVTAWRRAVALAPDDADLGADLAEALTLANQGVVPEEARTRFERVQAARPDDPRAGHYLALARLQAGDERGALDRWAKLVAASPANAPWLPMVRQRLAEIADRLHLDPAAITPQPRPAEPPAAAGSEEQTRALAATLTARLKTNPGDADGWLRLIAAYENLADTPARLDAARRASAANPQNPDLQVARAEAVLATTPATDDRLPPEAATALRTALTLAPDTPAALWYLALDAAATGHPADARPLLERLLKQLEPGGDEYRAVKARLSAVTISPLLSGPPQRSPTP